MTAQRAVLASSSLASQSCHKCSFGQRSFAASFSRPEFVPRSSDEWLWLGYLFISAMAKWNVSMGGKRNNSLGPIRDNRNGCLIYIAIRLAVFIHHFRLFITPVKNSMQWISCDIKSQFFLKTGDGFKIKRLLIKRRRRVGVNDAAVIAGCTLTSKRWPCHPKQHGEVTMGGGERRGYWCCSCERGPLCNCD